MATKRKSISKKTRFDVFKRDSFTCQYCGAHPPSVVLHVDHVDPVANGGSNDIDNLVTSCDSCNLGKGARLLGDIPQTLKDKAAEAKEREDQIRGYQAVLESKASREYDEQWRVAEIIRPGSGKDGFPTAWLRSIKMFNKRLGVFEVIDSAETAMLRPRSEADAFRYFCGICWKKIKEASA